MKKIIITYIIIVAVLSCTATFINVRGSDNTTISTEANRDSINLGDWNWEDNDSINFDRSKDKRHYKNQKDTTNVTTK